MALGELDFEVSESGETEEIDDAFAAFGLALVGEAGEGGETFWLWPENLTSWQIWRQVQTQWMVGMQGATGLSYPGIEVVLRHHERRPGAQRRRFAEIQQMERAALEAWEEKRDRQ